MRLNVKKIQSILNTRMGLVWFSVFCIWLKTLAAYFFTFGGLHAVNAADYLLMLVNPIGFTAIFLSLMLFINRKQLFYLFFLIMNLAGSLLVYANVLYYREFQDFLTINTITGGAGMVGHGFDYSSIPVHWFDIFFWIDIIVIVLLFVFKVLKMDDRSFTKMRALKVFSISLMIFALNFMGGDMTEHRLISRQALYDDTYVVRYLGLGPWLATNGWYTHVANKARENATKLDFTKVQNYVKDNRYLAPNVKMYGIAKNRNVIEIHLESFQQDLINLSIKGTDGKEHVVTPFLNSLYNNQGTGGSVYSYSNFFNQVGQGKTSDAENMLETSTFGLSTGSLFTKVGSTQTFQAMPAILGQTEGYSSAVFHGNVGSFYNRNATYRQMGYQNFFDQTFWDDSGTRGTAWGIKDKLLFDDSTQWLEQLQQPFYAKYLTVTNHLPYTMDKEDLDPNFATVNSGDEVVDNYFLTAHYLDQSVQEFFQYLKKSGLYDKSVIVLYGDHYGISGSDTKAFAPYVGMDPSNLTDYDTTMMQRTPFMIDIPGQTNGYTSNEFVGEIDVMPTLEHLLGVPTQNYIQFGQDMFSDGRQNYVALRNKGWVTAQYTKPSGSSNVVYDTKTGNPITPTAAQTKEFTDIQNKVNTMLNMSDALNNENLLRFYTPPGFTPVDAKNYSYSKSSATKRLKDQQDSLKAKSTSLLSENHGISTESLYKTDAPEVDSKEIAEGTSTLHPQTPAEQKVSSSSSSTSSSSSKGGK